MSALDVSDRPGREGEPREARNEARDPDGSEGRNTAAQGAQAPEERGPTRDWLGTPPGEGRDAGQPASPGETPEKTEPADKEGPPPRMPRKRVFVAVGLVLLALLAWGGWKHWSRGRAAGDTQAQTTQTVVEVRTKDAARDNKPIDITLPGQTEAFETANIFPRATGYITQRHVDIGSRVTKGTLLVHISAPDLDQQLAQAQAQLGQVQASEAQAHAQVAQADANLNLAKVTLARTATLTQQGWETLQNRDNQAANQQSQQANLQTAQAGVKVAEANTKAQQATVDRLKALTGFEDVVAPFDGIVTVRNVDNGDLVNADSSSATPMFSLARDDVIRVTVQVPQNASAGVRDGVPATVEVPSDPGEHFAGTVTRSSVALLSSARTLDTEVDVPNPQGRIRPGLFVYVTMHIPRDHPEVVVPSEALIFNQNGLQVAVAAGGVLKLHTIKIARDFGTSVAVSDGLSGGEAVVLSPPALVKDGEKIKAKRSEDEKGDDGQKGGADGQAEAQPDGTPPGEDGQAQDGKGDGKSDGKSR